MSDEATVTITRLTSRIAFVCLLLVCVSPGTGAFAETDTDGDGMPDSWELLYSTPPTTTGLVATNDLDSDGANNLAEWTAFTNPTNPASVFRVESIRFNPTNGAAIAWGSASNRAYGVDWTSNLLMQFGSLVTNVGANPPQNVYTDTTHLALLCGFYRLKARWTGTFDVMTCIECHSKIQGSRRAVVLDFTNVSHHVLGPVTTNDCLACHNTAAHQGGLVRLYNADSTNTLYTLTDDPLTNSAAAASLNPFCLACHDANGANGLPPFSDGRMPPVRSNAAWVASAHALKPLSCFGDGQTFGCHATTHGSKKLHMLAPFDVAATAPNFAQQEEGFCFTCHNGSIATKSVTNDFTKAIHHPIVNSESSRAVECTDCHNPHAAQVGASVYTNAATATRNLVGKPNLGVSGWAVSYAGLANFDAPTNVNYTVLSNAVYQYQICFKCHSAKSWSFGTPPNGLSANGTSTTPPETDAAQAFSPMNKSGHPVVSGLNSYPNSTAPKALLASNLKAPWTNNVGTQTMDCNDCHNTDAASPAAQGPHGSAKQFMLRTFYTNGIATTATNWPSVTLGNFATQSWCANCHNKGTTPPHSTGSHSSIRCYQCHIVIPHGGKMSRLIADSDGVMPARYAYSGNKANVSIQAFKKEAPGSYSRPNCDATCAGDHDPPAGLTDENW